MFAARGIAVVIAAEHHASLLGAIGSGFLSLDIWVAAEEAEEAAALLRDLRESDAGAAATDADGADPAGDADDDFDVQAYTERRRRTGLAILLACFVTFGTGHMVTGAWLRGVALAAIETLGIRLLVHGNRIGSALIVATVAADLIGALWRLRAASPPPLPVARIRRG